MHDINTITDRITAFTDFDTAAFGSRKLGVHPRYRRIRPRVGIKSYDVYLSLGKVNHKTIAL